MPTAKPAAVGAFILGGLGLAVAAILLFGSISLFTSTVRAVAFFPGSVAGLSIGAPVTFRGVRVGSVREIRLRLDASDLQAQIPVFLDLDPYAVTIDRGSIPQGEAGLKRLLEAGLRAQLTSQSVVTGTLQVELDLRPGTQGQVVHSDVVDLPEIPTIPSPLQDLQHRVESLRLDELVSKSISVLASVQRVADQLSEQIGPIAANLQQTTDAARVTLQTATDTVQQVRNDSATVMSNIDRLTNGSRQQVDDRGAELSRLLNDTDHTVRDIQGVVASLNGFLGPRSDARGNLDAMLRDLAASAGSLRVFSRELERNPSALLLGRGSR